MNLKNYDGLEREKWNKYFLKNAGSPWQKTSIIDIIVCQDSKTFLVSTIPNALAALAYDDDNCFEHLLSIIKSANMIKQHL